MWFSGNPPSERCIFFNKQGSCFYQILPEFRHRPHSLPIAPVAPFEPEKAINVFCPGNSPGVPEGGFCRRLMPFFIFIKCLAHDKKPGVDLLSCSGHQAVHIPLKPLFSALFLTVQKGLKLVPIISAFMGSRPRGRLMNV